MSDRVRDESGVATVMAASLAVVLMAIAGVVVSVGQVVLTRQLAASAADLASLSAASRLLAGAAVDGACEAAAAVTTRQGAEVVQCIVEGEDVRVEVRRAPPPWLVPVVSAAGSPDGAVHADARAGPQW